MIDIKKFKYTYRGRVSLFLILKSMDIKPDDVVAVQSYTCSAVIEAILAAKAKPLFIDIKSENLMICENDLIKKIENVKNIKALIIQYTFGIYFNAGEIINICKKKNIFLIEDCCHFNPKLENKEKIGLKGDASFFSFEWGKPVAGGIGGAYYINNEKLIEKSNYYFNQLKSPPYKNEALIFFQYLIFKLFYNPTTYWFLKDTYNFLSKKGLIIGNFNKIEIINKTFDFNLKSLLISRKIIEKNFNRSKVRSSFQLFKEVQKKCEEIKIEYKLKINNGNSIPLLRIPFLLKNKNKILSIAKNNKIELASWYESPVHPYKLEALNKIGYEEGSCPNAEMISNKLVSIPLNISSTKLNKFFEIVKKYD